jgi:hypothetical protein
MKKGLEPAFPCIDHNENGSDFDTKFIPFSSGISTRLYLAGMALQGLLSNPNTAEQIRSHVGGVASIEISNKIVTATALAIIDELLKQEEETR